MAVLHFDKSANSVSCGAHGDPRLFLFLLSSHFCLLKLIFSNAAFFKMPVTELDSGMRFPVYALETEN